MLFRDGQRILGVISTMSVVHFFQMNFSYQPIKHRDEKPRDLSKALGKKAPHFRLTQRERHHRYPSRKIPRMRMLLSPKYGKHSRLPSNNKAATFRDKPSWCPTRCCWCKIDLRTGCSVWHQPSQDGMQGDTCIEMPAATPDLVALVYVLHLHGTWNIYRSQVLRTSQAELCNSNFANSIRVNDLRPQNQLQTGPTDGQKQQWNYQETNDH